VKRRHGSRGWPARGTAHEDGRRRRATRAAAREGKQREEEEEADRWGPAGIFIFFSFFFQGCDTGSSIKYEKKIRGENPLKIPHFGAPSQATLA